MLEQTTLEVIAVNDHRKCYRGDHTTVIVIMPSICDESFTWISQHCERKTGVFKFLSKY